MRRKLIFTDFLMDIPQVTYYIEKNKIKGEMK